MPSEPVHSEKSLARSMLLYSRNCQQQNWVQFVLNINSDCMYIGELWLQLWLKNLCKNTRYYSIIQLSLLQLLNSYQYNCNNTISSVSVDTFRIIINKQWMGQRERKYCIWQKKEIPEIICFALFSLLFHV